MNICQHLAEGAGRTPDAPALIDLDAPGGRVALTYRELWQRVCRTAASLRALGLAPGDRVAMLVPNSREYVEAFLAVAAAGLVSVPMNIRLLEDELLHMVRDSGARLLVVDGELLARHRALAGVPALGCAVARPVASLEGRQFAFDVLGGGEARAALASTSLASTAPASTAPAPGAPMPSVPAPCAPGDLCSLMYTSGTTGLPKGVMLSHGAWSAVSDYTRRYLRYGEREVTLHAAPLTHGAGFLMLPTFASGGTNVVCTRFDAARTLRLFRDEGITNGFFVPSMIRMLIDEPELPEGPPRALRALYYAGSPIDPDTLRGAMARFGDVLVQSFGQMEAPMWLTVLDRADHQRIRSGAAAHLIRAAGRPVDGADVRVVDDDGRALPQGEAGEIVARAPQHMLGYWNRPEATADALKDAWLHTGDVGRFDADGYLYIVDRKKDMVISGGANVYAREVEEVLLAIPGVREAAVIGLPHPKWGEMVTAVLVADAGSVRPGDDDVHAFCRARLADYRRPKRVLWLDALPRNAYGKVLKRSLREQLAHFARESA